MLLILRRFKSTDAERNHSRLEQADAFFEKEAAFWSDR
jgi:hypothetical protein